MDKFSLFSCAINHFFNEALSNEALIMFSSVITIILISRSILPYYQKNRQQLTPLLKGLIIFIQILPLIATPLILGAVFYRSYRTCEARAVFARAEYKAKTEESFRGMYRLLFDYFIAESIGHSTMQPSSTLEALVSKSNKILFSKKVIDRIAKDPDYLVRLKDARYKSKHDISIDLDQKWQLSDKLENGQILLISFIGEEGPVPHGTLSATAEFWKIDNYEIR